jgi:trehalose 6-phosphate synthase
MDARPKDLAARMSAMRSQLRDHDILAWARTYLMALDDTGRLTEWLPTPAIPRPRRTGVTPPAR